MTESTKKWDSKKLLDALIDHYGKFYYHLTNSFIYEWESDFFCLSKEGYAYEVEVKISRADFRADFKKVNKHKILGSRGRIVTIPDFTGKYSLIKGKLVEAPHTYVRFVNGRTSSPNRFIYLAPVGVIPHDEVPEYAGLMEIDHYGSIDTVIKPPFIHKHKNNLSKRLLEKFYWLYKNLLNQNSMKNG